jgi:predicted component of type VI protein secretion system
MPPELIALTDGPDILLDKPIMLLGRHHECDIQLNSRKVSRRHCCLAQVSDYLVVRDLCSTNGIRINGERVHEGRLNPGDELTIGNFAYKIRWVGHPAQPLSGDNGSGDKPALPARLVGTGGDEALESCEEPVALESAMNLSELRPKDKAPAAQETSSKPSDSKKPQMEDQPPSLILPDHIDLAPFSDEFSKDK